MTLPKNAPVCVIDCGSNTTRVLIRSADAVLLRTTSVTRLSEGADTAGIVSKEATERVLTVLEKTRVECETLGVTKGVLVSTSAIRDAANAGEFLERAAAACGLKAVVISGYQEAAYSFDAATMNVCRANALVIDIGGSSTELAKENPVVGLDTASLQLGSVRLAERALGTSPVSLESALAGVGMITDALLAGIERSPWLRSDLSTLNVVTIGGTAECLASLVNATKEGLTGPTPDPFSINLMKIATPQVRSVKTTLTSLAPAAIKDLPGMIPGRETTITAGVLILDALLQHFSIKEVTFSANSLVDAIAQDLLTNPN
jgi:exopolyphosphatase/guanosine-5'-triphosphate,3'-diphosphate pyrophosphatase